MSRKPKPPPRPNCSGCNRIMTRRTATLCYKCDRQPRCQVCGAVYPQGGNCPPCKQVIEDLHEAHKTYTLEDAQEPRIRVYRVSKLFPYRSVGHHE